MNYIQAQHWFRLTSVSIFALYCSQHPYACHTTHWPQICCISQAVVDAEKHKSMPFTVPREIHPHRMLVIKLLM